LKLNKIREKSTFKI